MRNLSGLFRCSDRPAFVQLDCGVTERIHELDLRLEQQEARADDLRHQLKTANPKNDRMQELANYVEDERRVEQQWREAGLLTKTKWRLFGMPSEAQESE